jgi:hypothetical protein
VVPNSLETLVYERPSITKLGSVADLTKAFGNPALDDTIQFGSSTFEANGSWNGVVVPAPPS